MNVLLACAAFGLAAKLSLSQFMSFLTFSVLFLAGVKPQQESSTFQCKLVHSQVTTI